MASAKSTGDRKDTTAMKTALLAVFFFFYIRLYIFRQSFFVQTDANPTNLSWTESLESQESACTNLPVGDNMVNTVCHTSKGWQPLSRTKTYCVEILTSVKYITHIISCILFLDFRIVLTNCSDAREL